MPELKTYDDPGLPAKDLRKDDIFWYGEIECQVAERVDWKTKYVYVPLVGVDKPLRLEANLIVKVARTEETEDEYQARRAGYVEHYLEEAYNEALNARTEARNAMVVAVTDDRPMDIDYRYGRAFDTLIQYEYMANIWLEVRGMKDVELKDGTKLDTWAAAVRYVRVRKMEMLYDNSDLYRSSSRSTSTVTNFIHDLQREVIADFLRGLKWKLDD